MFRTRCATLFRLCKLNCEIFSTKSDRLQYGIQISAVNRRFFAHSTVAIEKKISLVIFDKDGTLICFHAMWGPWANCIAESIHFDSSHPTVDMAMEVYKMLGYCPLTNEVRQGLLAEATMLEIRIALINLLIRHGVKDERARQIVDKAVKECDTSNKLDTVKPLDDLHRLFITLKENQIKIALCTADNRKQTIASLNRLGVTKYFDMIVCGDDADAKPKPNPYNARKICKNLNVNPGEAAMVGDTKTDIEFGRSSNLGQTIGVLSGVSRAEDLNKQGADRLVNRVGDIVPLIIKQKRKPPTILNHLKHLLKKFSFSNVIFKLRR